MELIIYIEMDLALNNLQRLICHKTQQTKPNLMNFFMKKICSHVKNYFENKLMLHLVFIVVWVTTAV